MGERPLPAPAYSKRQHDSYTVWRWLSIALRAGIALDDLRRMSMRDFIYIMDVMTEQADSSGSCEREATQADIDAFFM